MNIRLIVGLGIQEIATISCSSLDKFQQASYILEPLCSSDIAFELRLKKLDSITWDIYGGAWLDKCDLDADEIALKLLYRNGKLVNENDAGCPDCGGVTLFFDEGNPLGSYCPLCNKLFDECGIEIPQIKAR